METKNIIISIKRPNDINKIVRILSKHRSNVYGIEKIAQKDNISYVFIEKGQFIINVTTPPVYKGFSSNYRLQPAKRTSEEIINEVRVSELEEWLRN